MKNKIKIFYLYLYCDSCRSATWHMIEQGNPSMVITCGECGKTNLDYKYGRNSVNRLVWDKYAREKRKLGSKNI